LLVVGPVVVVDETIAVDILALIGIEVQLAQTVEVNLLQQIPVRLNVNRGVPVPRRLIIIFPTEAPTPPAASASPSTAPAIVSVAVLLASTSGALELLATAPAVSALTPLATTATCKDGTPAVS
jgi:hypothetical protein